MKNNYLSLINVVVLSAVIFWIYYAMMPQSVPADSSSLSRFSTKRALEKVAAISGAPHYVGSGHHENVAAYLIKELQSLGLETKIQEGYTLSDWGNLVKAKIL